MHQNCVAKLRRLQYEILRSGLFHAQMVGNYKRSIGFMWQCTLNMAEEGINIWPLQISAPLRRKTWIGKTIRFIWLFRPNTAEITIRYTGNLYYIQIYGI